MDKRLLAVIFIFSLTIFMVVWAGEEETNRYKLVWQDLFEGDTLNETDNWYIEEYGDGSGNGELQYYRRENVSIEKEPVSGVSCLVLTAKKEKFEENEATSGRVITHNKMTFKYGKIEARIKLPKTANGLWPAFWLLGDDYFDKNVGWPKCGEIDILEMGHLNGIRYNVQDRFFNGACHWGYYEEWGYPMYAVDKTNSYSIQDDFHLFTLIWDENSISMYLDMDIYPDEPPYYEMSISDTSAPQSPGHYFHKPFFVILNLAVGGHFPGILNVNEVTAWEAGEAKMYIDYVKLYQRGEIGEEFTGIGISTGVNPFERELSADYEYNPIERNVRFSNPVQEISIHDLNGRTVKKKLNDSEISTDNLPSGMYLFHAKDYREQLISGKIIVN